MSLRVSCPQLFADALLLLQLGISLQQLLLETLLFLQQFADFPFDELEVINEVLRVVHYSQGVFHTAQLAVDQLILLSLGMAAAGLFLWHAELRLWHWRRRLVSALLLFGAVVPHAAEQYFDVLGGLGGFLAEVRVLCHGL